MDSYKKDLFIIRSMQLRIWKVSGIVHRKIKVSFFKKKSKEREWMLGEIEKHTLHVD